MTDVKQLPEAFLKEMEQLLGDEYEAYIKSYEEAWKPGLRVNTLKITPEEFNNRSHLNLIPGEWTETGRKKYGAGSKITGKRNAGLQ